MIATIGNDIATTQVSMHLEQSADASYYLSLCLQMQPSGASDNCCSGVIVCHRKIWCMENLVLLCPLCCHFSPDCNNPALHLQPQMLVPLLVIRHLGTNSTLHTFAHWPPPPPSPPSLDPNRNESNFCNAMLTCRLNITAVRHQLCL